MGWDWKLVLLLYEIIYMTKRHYFYGNIFMNLKYLSSTLYMIVDVLSLLRTLERDRFNEFHFSSSFFFFTSFLVLHGAFRPTYMHLD